MSIGPLNGLSGLGMPVDTGIALALDEMGNTSMNISTKTMSIQQKKVRRRSACKITLPRLLQHQEFAQTRHLHKARILHRTAWNIRFRLR